MAGPSAPPGSSQLPLLPKIRIPHVPSEDDVDQRVPVTAASKGWAKEIAEPVNNLVEATAKLVEANIKQAAISREDNNKLIQLMLVLSHNVTSAVFDLAEVVKTSYVTDSDDPPRTNEQESDQESEADSHSNCRRY